MPNSTNNSLPYKKVFILGSFAYDEIMNFPGSFKDHIFPEKIHQLNVSFVVNQLEKQLGGTSFNIAYNLSLLLDPQLIYPVGAVGKDGSKLIQFLSQRRINVDYIHQDEHLYTSTGKCITDKDDNQIWGFYHGAAVSAKNIKLNPSSNSLFILSPTHPDIFSHFQTYLIRHKIPYLYDPGMLLTTLPPQTLRQGILHATYLVGNDYEISRLFTITQLDPAKIVPRTPIITTLGDQGVTYQSSTQTLSLPAFSVQTKDPTGAGDAWRAGFVAGVLSNMSIDQALALGNSLASFAVEHYGTTNHRPSRCDIVNRQTTILKEVGL